DAAGAHAGRRYAGAVGDAHRSGRMGKENSGSLSTSMYSLPVVFRRSCFGIAVDRREAITVSCFMSLRRSRCGLRMTWRFGQALAEGDHRAAKRRPNPEERGRLGLACDTELLVEHLPVAALLIETSGVQVLKDHAGLHSGGSFLSCRDHQAAPVAGFAAMRLPASMRNKPRRDRVFETIWFIPRAWYFDARRICSALSASSRRREFTERTCSSRAWR